MKLLQAPPQPLLLAPGDLRREHWIVRPCALETAQRMVRQYHYAGGGSNTAVACFGLFHKSRCFWEMDCYGITWWIPPASMDAATATYPDDPYAVLALSRLVIHPGAPHNAASFLLARSVKLLDPRWECLVTYADTWQGHTGTIYKASNWHYVGLTDPEWVYTKNGRNRSRRRGDRTLNHQQMIAEGYIPEGRFAKHKFILMRV